MIHFNGKDANNYSDMIQNKQLIMVIHKHKIEYKIGKW